MTAIRSWLISGVAVLPFTFLLWIVFDLSDWEGWAFMAAAFWWRVIGPLDEAAE